MLRAGKLRYFGTIEQLDPDAGNDAAGQPVIEWVTFATANGELLPLVSGFERLIAGALQSGSMFKFTCRRIEGVTTAMRFNYRGRIFDIRSTRDIEERTRVTEMILEEGVNRG